MRSTFSHGKSRPLAYRKRQLYQLYRCLEENERELLEAMERDGKNRSEATISDLMVVTKEISHVLQQLDQWTRPQRTPVGWTFAMTMDTAEIVPVSSLAREKSRAALGGGWGWLGLRRVTLISPIA